MLADEDRVYMERVTAGIATKSERIRLLDAAGYTRSQIAEFLGIRYQHVRNVLVDAPAGWKAPALPPRPDTPSLAAEPELVPDVGSLAVEDDGSVVVPAELVRRLGGRPGRRVAWLRDDAGLRLLDREAGLRSAQDLVAERLGSGGTAATDALLAERRKEAERG